MMTDYEGLMDYGTFKVMVEEHFLEYMPDAFKNCEVKIIRVEKINKTSDGLTLLGMENGNKGCGPVVYVDDMYALYRQYESLEAVLVEMADEMTGIYARVSSVPGGTQRRRNFDRSSVILQLGNTEKNQELLKTCPSRPFLDLTIIYKAMIYIGEDKTVGTRVNYQMAEDLGMDEEALYQKKKKNTRRLLPFRMVSLKALLDELRKMEGEALEPEEIKIPMYVLTNDIRIGGAAALLYKEMLDRLAWMLGSDLYILPSSLHEVIAVPAYNRMLDGLKQMVFEINRTEVSPEDWLSDQVYRYNREERTVTVAEEKQADPEPEFTVCQA